MAGKAPALTLLLAGTRLVLKLTADTAAGWRCWRSWASSRRCTGAAAASLMAVAALI